MAVQFLPTLWLLVDFNCIVLAYSAFYVWVSTSVYRGLYENKTLKKIITTKMVKKAVVVAFGGQYLLKPP